MKKWMKRLLQLAKEEKGLTLVELLAVIVILGIIAAIAVPAIGGLIGNTKKEAHKANAHQLIEAARQYVTIHGFKETTVQKSNGDSNETSGDGVRVNAASFDNGSLQNGSENANGTYKAMKITAAALQTAGYIGKLVDPEASTSGESYNNLNDSTAVYVVKDNLNYRYYVSLDSDGQDITVVLETDIDKIKFD
jgi:prepilin-type N-terminal cleavage/methylation domain-containing protein